MWDENGLLKSYPEGVPEGADRDWFLGMSKACIDAFTAIPPPRPAFDLTPIIREWLARRGAQPTDGEVAKWYAILGQWEVRPLYDFVPEALEELHRMGCRMGVVSNTLVPGRRHEAHFEEHGIAKYFEAAVFSANFGVNKPAPAIFRHVLDRMALDPVRTWYVGDKPHRDVRGAHAVGMTALLVDSTYHHQIAEAPENEPDLCIPTIVALPALLAGL
jgi:HAD superfamily hydrolase (TIGR01662 family)